jgi:RNA polymerase-binding transcription factor DksA
VGLTVGQRRHLERRLLEERARVVSALERYNVATRAGWLGESGELTVSRLHPADLGSASADRELDAALAARHSAELAEIDLALECLYQRPAEYGRCERSGEPIPYKRLDAIPWTRTCQDETA